MERINLEEIDDGERKLREQNLIPEGFEIDRNFDTTPGRECESLEECITRLEGLDKEVLVLNMAYTYRGKLLSECYVTILTKPKEETS